MLCSDSWVWTRTRRGAMLTAGTDADASRQSITRGDIYWYRQCHCDYIESRGGDGAVARSLLRGRGSRCAQPLDTDAESCKLTVAFRTCTCSLLRHLRGREASNGWQCLWTPPHCRRSVPSSHTAPQTASTDSLTPQPLVVPARQSPAMPS